MHRLLPDISRMISARRQVKFKEAPKKATKAAADTRKREMEEMKRKKAAARALAAQEAEKRRDEELELPPMR